MKTTKMLAILVLALGLVVWPVSMVRGDISLKVDDDANVTSITLEVGQSCTVEVASDDSMSYKTYVGFDNGLVLGSFTHLETRPASGGGDVELVDNSYFYGYEVIAGEWPFPGVHFVFRYVAQQLGETDLKLYNETRTSEIDSVHITIIPGNSDEIGTAFTYQGRLIDANSAADGLYDFQFKLYDANEAGMQKGITVPIGELDVIDGYFTVGLDFGSGVFTGDARWLEIGVRPGDSGSNYTTLSPRQKVVPTPYSLYAKIAGYAKTAGHAETAGYAGTAGHAETADSVPDGITGSGTANYITKFLSSSTIGNSVIYELSGNIGIGTTSPDAKLTVNGAILRDGSTMHGTNADTHINLGTNSTTGEYGQNYSYITIAGGQDNTASTSYSTVGGGQNNTASSDYATVSGGYSNEAGGRYSFAAGRQAKANHDGTFVWADSTSANFVSTDNNQFLIRASGGVGIGTTSPTSTLHVEGTIEVDQKIQADDSGGLELATDEGTIRLKIIDNGNVGIGTTTPVGALDVRRDEVRIWSGTGSVNYALSQGELYVQGDLEADGPVYMANVYGTAVTGRDVYVSSTGRLGYLSSSKRYKENIAPLEDDFSKILQAQAVTFTFKQTKEPGIGFIAEDMDELGLRNLVIYDAEGRPDSVRYDCISLYLLEVLKDQASSIKELKAENESLKEHLRVENQSLKQRLGALEKIMRQQQFAAAKEVQQ